MKKMIYSYFGDVYDDIASNSLTDGLYEIEAPDEYEEKWRTYIKDISTVILYSEAEDDIDTSGCKIITKDWLKEKGINSSEDLRICIDNYNGGVEGCLTFLQDKCGWKYTKLPVYKYDADFMEFDN